eukprot:scaffold105484_cov28-Tisochrysis_lutea.AAC.5
MAETKSGSVADAGGVERALPEERRGCSGAHPSVESVVFFLRAGAKCLAPLSPISIPLRLRARGGTHEWVGGRIRRRRRTRATQEMRQTRWRALERRERPILLERRGKVLHALANPIRVEAVGEEEGRAHE